MYKCSDCGITVDVKDPSRLAKGSAIREPGEALCGSCRASRAKLLSDLDQIPNTLDQIQAINASGGFYSRQGDIPRW